MYHYSCKKTLWTTWVAILSNLLTSVQYNSRISKSQEIPEKDGLIIFFVLSCKFKRVKQDFLPSQKVIETIERIKR